MSASFHAARLGLGRKASYGCTCGCGTCAGGSNEYGRAHTIRESGVFQPVTAMTAFTPGYGGVLSFETYNENDKWYRKCAEYRAAVEDFNKFRTKVVSKYGEYPSIGVKFGRDGKTDPKAKDKHLRSEGKAQARLKALQAKAVDALKRCKLAEKAGEEAAEGQIPVDTSILATPGAAGTAPPPVEQVSTDTTQQSGGGGSNMTLIVGIGAVALLGGAAFLVLKKKKAKKKGTPAPVTLSDDAYMEAMRVTSERK